MKYDKEHVVYFSTKEPIPNELTIDIRVDIAQNKEVRRSSKKCNRLYMMIKTRKPELTLFDDSGKISFDLTIDRNSMLESNTINLVSFANRCKDIYDVSIIGTAKNLKNDIRIDIFSRER